MATSTTESKTRVIYRCRKCKRVIRIDYLTITERQEALLRSAEGFEYRGQRVQRRYRLADGTLTYWLPSRACPDCGRTMSRSVVQATLNPKVHCSGRCTGATGPVCVCSCGGDNHGGRWVRLG